MNCSNEVKSMNIANCGVKRIKRDNKNPILFKYSYLPFVYFNIVYVVNKPLSKFEFIKKENKI